MGLIHDSRHRDALLQQFSGEIFRESHDQQALDGVSRRVLGHPEVRRDSMLESQLRSVISLRQVEVRERATAHMRDNADRQPTSSETAFIARAIVSPPAESSKPQIMSALARLQRDLNERLAHFDLSGSRSVIGRIDEIQKLHSDVISAATVERCRHDLAAVELKLRQLQQEICTLSSGAVDAAARGDHASAAQALKRLSLIHAARPSLLSRERIEKVRVELASAGKHPAHRDAAKVIVQRERAVAEEIRHIAEAVHEFHLISHQAAHDHPDYLIAEHEYHTAVGAVKAHDKEWFADLVLELDGLMVELHDPTGKSATQVMHFIESAQRALRKVIAEIREIDAEQHPAS